MPVVYRKMVMEAGYKLVVIPWVKLNHRNSANNRGSLVVAIAPSNQEPARDVYPLGIWEETLRDDQGFAGYRVRRLVGRQFLYLGASINAKHLELLNGSPVFRKFLQEQVEAE